MALLLPTTPKHRVFNYKPRYYDPQRERAEELRVLTGNANDGEILSDTTRLQRLRSRMHKGFQQAIYHRRQHAKNRTLLRILLAAKIILLLLIIFHFSSLLELLFASVGL